MSASALIVTEIVIDCSVVAKWVFPEPGSGAALELLRRYQRGEVELIAPDLLMMEFASLVSKRTRRNEISADQAMRAFELMEESRPALIDFRPRMKNALRLALRHHLSFWDASYVSLAVERRCVCMTADRRLFRNAIGRHPTLTLVE